MKPRSGPKRSRLVSALLFLFLAALAITFLSPLAYMFINSFKTKVEYYQSPFGLPTEWRLDNYIVMLDQFNILKSFANTYFISIVSVLVMMAMGICAGYAFAKLPFRGRGGVYMLIIGTMFIPAQVTMIPMYSIFSKAGLVNTYTGVIISFIAGGLPGAILLLTANFRAIPNEVIDAAKIDGAGYFRVVRHVVFPMGAAAIATNVIFTFVGQGNDLFTPMILLQDYNKRTVIVALSSLMTQTSGDPAFQLTGMLLAVIPPLLIYLCLQKYLAKGVTAGAIK